MFLIFIDYVSCGNPLGISNGDFTYTSDAAGSYAKLVCSRPFVQMGDGIFRCNENGEWKGNGGYCSM